MLTAFLMAEDAQRSMLSGMFSFMKKTSRVRHNPESEGIYLSDLNADELDPEVAALYFPSSHRGSTVVKGILVNSLFALALHVLHIKYMQKLTRQ